MLEMEYSHGYNPSRQGEFSNKPPGRGYHALAPPPLSAMPALCPFFRMAAFLDGVTVLIYSRSSLRPGNFLQLPFRMHGVTRK